jgi:hypothetical protein
VIDAVVFPNSNAPHAAHLASEELNIVGFHVTMIDGGDGTQFSFQLAVDSVASYTNRSMSLVGAVAQASPPTAHAPLSVTAMYAGVEPVQAGEVFGIVITGGPTTANAGGQLMTVTIEARRKIV